MQKKIFDKIPHPFMTKTLGKLNIFNFFLVENRQLYKFEAKILLKNKSMDIFTMRFEKTKDVPLTTYIEHCACNYNNYH